MTLLLTSGCHLAGICWDRDALTHACLQWTDSCQMSYDTHPQNSAESTPEENMCSDFSWDSINFLDSRCCVLNLI